MDNEYEPWTILLVNQLYGISVEQAMFHVTSLSFMLFTVSDPLEQSE